MSRSVHAVVACSDCRAESEVTLWVSLNATLDPHLKKKLLRNQLLVFQCAECGSTSPFEYDLLYHDMKRHILLQLVPEGGSIHSGRDFVEALELSKEFMPGYQYRIVHSRNALVEKIIAFDQGLDDRVIELLKLSLSGRFAASDEQVEVRLASVKRRLFGARIRELYFVRTDDPENAAIVPYQDGYLKAEQFLASRYPGYAATHSTWVTVDKEWAIDIVSELVRDPAEGELACRAPCRMVSVRDGR